jgi:hypothetical protein
LLGALGWAAVWFLVAAAVVLPYVRSYTHLSPFDELVHVDYMVKAQHFELVNGGERVGQTAMREQACRGHDIEALEFPPCRSAHFDPRAFPETGFNTAYADPPIYYVLTGVAAEGVDALPGIASVVTAGRAVGVLWLGAGLAVTFVLSRRLGADVVPAAGATAALAATPVVAHASATITSDAPALLVGGGLCLLALAVAEGRRAWLWMLPAGFVALAIKATMLTVVGLVVVFLVVTWFGSSARRRADGAGDGSDRGSRPLLAAASLVAGSVAALGGWTMVTALTAGSALDDIPMKQTFHVDSLTWSDLVGNVLPLFSPVQLGYTPPFLQDVTVGTLMAVLNILLLIGVVSTAWIESVSTVAGRMAIATVAAMLASGPALVVMVYVGAHTFTPIPTRYGLSLLPPAVASLAVLASRRRAGGLVLAGLGTATVGSFLLQTL